MARRLPPAQRAAYEHLRVLTEDIIARHATVPQRVLAESVGVHQTMVSNVLKGRMTSFVTLALIARVIMPMVAANDQRALQGELARVESLMRQPRR